MGIGNALIGLLTKGIAFTVYSFSYDLAPLQFSLSDDFTIAQRLGPPPHTTE